MKFVFEHSALQWWSVIGPIYDEMIKQGLPVQKGGSTNKEDCYIWCRGGVKYPERSIYVPHGISGAELSRTVEIMKEHKLLACLLPGSFWLQRFEKDLPGGNYEMVGWPKSDILFSENVDSIKEEMTQRFNLEGRKTVLFSGSGVYLAIDYCMKREKRTSNVWESLRELTKRCDVNILIKPHDEGSPYVVPESYKAPRMIWTNPKVHGNIMPFFFVADVLVSNSFSSVPHEFLLMDKPIIFYEDGSFAEEVGIVSTNVGGDVERALDGVDSFKDKRKKWLQKLIYKPDGHASERVVDAILEMVG